MTVYICLVNAFMVPSADAGLVKLEALSAAAALAYAFPLFGVLLPAAALSNALPLDGMLLPAAALTFVFF